MDYSYPPGPQPLHPQRWAQPTDLPAQTPTPPLICPIPPDRRQQDPTPASVNKSHDHFYPPPRKGHWATTTATPRPGPPSLCMTRRTTDELTMMFDFLFRTPVPYLKSHLEYITVSIYSIYIYIYIHIQFYQTFTTNPECGSKINF